MFSYSTQDLITTAPGHAQRRAVFLYVILNVCIHGMSIMALNPRSLENLKPENRTRDKQRRNFTLLPSTIAWLGKQGNASESIDRLIVALIAGEASIEVYGASGCGCFF